jgi:hypothetical protein
MTAPVLMKIQPPIDEINKVHDYKMHHGRREEIQWALGAHNGGI